MITFFRRIRQNLMSENRVSKYLIYALGEILLVVIGILIALQINNWNEFRKERELERVLLNGIYKSLVQDTIYLQREIGSYDRQLEYAAYIKEKFANGTPYQKRLDTAFAQIAIGHLYAPDYTAFDRLESVGVDIVKNDSIRNMTVHYYAFSRFLKEVEDYYENSKYYRQQIFPKYFKSYKYAREAVPVDYQALRESSEFRIALDYSINDAYWFKGRAAHRKKDALILIRLLEEMLKADPNG